MPKEIEKLAPAASILVEGIVSKAIEKGDIAPKTIMIHEALISHLNHQAHEDKAIGFLGIDELKHLKELSVKHDFEIIFAGKSPHPAELKHTSLEELDAMITNICYEEGAVLFTHDKIQARTAEIKGIKVLYKEFERISKPLMLEKYFDNATMSVHLRENLIPSGKKGFPGNWEFIEIGSKPLSRDEIQEISREIIETAGIRKDAFIEIERPCSTIVQLGSYRIVITKPPLSDGWEITAVKPVKKLSLKDYNLSERLAKRIETQAEGVLIAGSPGMGKSTFAQALAEFYSSKKKVVKTIEAPRDLVLKDDITQYAISHGDAQEIHDILLLSRPDYTIFDEMRNTADFHLFSDLRLAGIGLAGVVHASAPVDAIQRFVGRIELGVIPQVIDTVIFIKDGKVAKVLSINMTVKVPEGMTEEDLARPVVVITDFETKKPEYELYSYGEETVVVPVKGERKSSSMHRLAARAIEDEFLEFTDHAKSDVISDHKAIVYVPESKIARIIGKQGENISKIEKKLGIGIDIMALTDYKGEDSEKQETSIPFEKRISRKAVQLIPGITYQNKDIHIYHEGDFVMTAKVGKAGIININKKSKLGKMLADAITMGEEIELRI